MGGVGTFGVVVCVQEVAVTPGELLADADLSPSRVVPWFLIAFAKRSLPPVEHRQNIGLMNLPQTAVFRARRCLCKPVRICLTLFVLRLVWSLDAVAAGDALPEVSVSSVRRTGVSSHV